MARADYRLCDKCGRKAFYDATLDYDFRTYPDTGLRNLGDWTVLCRECAAQFKCVIVELDSKRPHVNEHQKCHNCGAKQISTHLAGVKREWWECVKCGEMACKAIEGEK